VDAGIGGEPFLHHPHHALEIRAGAVHFIDHGEAGDAEFVRLAPHRLGLGLHAADRAENRHGAVENPQAVPSARVLEAMARNYANSFTHFALAESLRHAERLHDTFGTFPHTISVPRFKHAFGAPIAAAPAPVSDAAFERIVILYRLSVPSAGVVVSTREPAALRERCLDIGATQVSAGSKTDPGGYGDGVRRHESEQFEVDDTRPIEEMVRVILRRGYLPSLCTSCYRRRRTGNVFTEMALDGHIKEFCLPNALLTLAEYAVGNADPALRDQCLAAVAAGRKDLDDSALRPEFDRKLSLVLSGAKDLFF